MYDTDLIIRRGDGKKKLYYPRRFAGSWGYENKNPTCRADGIEIYKQLVSLVPSSFIEKNGGIGVTGKFPTPHNSYLLY
jgi:hypothetical protein